MVNIYNEQNKNNNVEPEEVVVGLKNKKRPDFRKYEDVTSGYSGKELAYSFWFVKHKVLLYRLLIISLVVFNVITVLWSGSQWAQYLIVGRSNDTKLAQSLATPVNYAVFHEHFGPQPIQVLGTQLLPSGVNKFDAVAEVGNGNTRWKVEFDFSFTIAGKTTKPEHAVVLPGEQRPLVAFGVEEAGGSGVNLVLENFHWQRVPNKIVPDTKSWQDMRLNFLVNDFVFTPAAASELAANDVQFTLSNDSAYGYVVPRFYVGLYSGESLVGVLPLELRRLRSSEKANVNLRSYVTNLQVDSARVFPLINVYDPAVFLPPGT